MNERGRGGDFDVFGDGGVFVGSASGEDCDSLHGKYETTQFNSRLQPTQIGLGNSTTDTSLLRSQYGYGTTANNGNVLSQTISVPNAGASTGFTATQSYTYDPLNRLESATEMAADHVNYALASNGATATASSEYNSGYAVSGVINGDRKGTNWASGGGWNDATDNSWPDWAQVEFSAAKTIDEIDVFTVQDSFNSPSEPTESMTFTNFGITSFDVQYWDGSAWQTIQSVTGNNKVWRKFTFSPVTTTKIRVSVNGSPGAFGYYSRITEIEAWGAGTSSSQAWKQEFSYDRYGNRNFVTGSGKTTTLGSCTTMCNPAFSSTTNRITSSGYTFDSAGNTTADPAGRTFVYDAENKQTSVSNSGGTLGTYLYDGDGKRVKKDASTGDDIIFIYDAGGKLIEERNLSGTLQTSYVYAGGRLLSTETSSGTTYLTADHLGSPRINTDGSGNVVARHDYYPFGEEIYTSQRTTGVGYAGDGVRKQFTGYEHDGETGLDFAQARMYSNKLGRFANSDPTLASIHIENPQSINRYLYTLNNPLAYIDPDGMDSLKIGTYDNLSPEQKRLFETYVKDKYAKEIGDGSVSDYAKNLFNKSADLANGDSSGDKTGLLSQSQLTTFIGVTSMLEKKGVIGEVASISSINGDETKGHEYRLIGDLKNTGSSVDAIKKAFPSNIAGKGHGEYSESHREGGLFKNPNGQVSRNPNGTGVDIDVDYRCILCPGHTKDDGSNSDLRVGTHYEDHVKRYGPIPALTRIKDQKEKKR